MPRRYFNWRLAVVLVIAAGALFATAYALRKWQRSTGAEEARQLGLVAFEKKNWLEAASQLGKYIAVHPGDVEALSQYAQAQLQIRPTERGRVQQAIGAYRAILRVEPENLEAVRSLMELYLPAAAGEAELVANRYLEQTDNPEVRMLRASAMAAQRKYAEAVAELKTVVEQDPGLVLAYDALARLAESRAVNVGAEASHWYDQAVERNPDSALALILRAQYRLQRADPDKAREDLARAETLDLTKAEDRLRIADAFLRLNDIERAEAHLDALRETEPELPVLWTLWGRLAIQSGSGPRMLRVAEQGLEELAAQPWDFIPLAVELFVRAGDLDQAKQHLDQYDQKGIDPGVTAFLRGLLADARHDNQEAIRRWQRAIELGQKTPTVRLMLARALEQAGDLLSAQQQLRNLVAEHPNHFQANLALARLLARSGDWMEALDVSRKAKQLAPDNLDAAVIHLQSAVQLQTVGVQPAGSVSLEDLEAQVAQLAQRTGESVDVLLLQVTLAIQRDQYSRAETLLNDVKTRFPNEPRVDLARVQLAMAREQTDQAAQLLQDAAARYPDDPAVLRLLAVYRAEEEDRAGCEQVLKAAVDRLESPAARRQMGLLLAHYYRTWGQEDKACAFLQDLARTLPADVAVRRRLLRCQPILADPAKAQGIIDEIKAIEGDAGWQWRYEQARFWYASPGFRDREADIVSLLNENLRRNVEDQESRSLLAAVYDRLGKLQSAISLYREVLSDSGATADMSVPAIAALYRAGEYDEGQRLLTQALRKKPDDPTLLRLQLDAAIRRGDTDTAVALLESMLEKNPDDGGAGLSLALLEIQQENYGRAAELLDALDAQDTNAFLLSHARIQLAVGQGRLEDAMGLCDHLVTTVGNASAYLLRARTRAGLGQIEQAEADFKKAADLEPGNVDVYVALADFYRSRGLLEQAIATAEQARTAQPDSVRPAKLWLALALESSDRAPIDKAEQEIGTLLAKFPNDNDLKLLHAKLLLRKGTQPAIAQAMETLQRIVSEAPTLADAWVTLAQMQLQYGQAGRALDTVLRGLSYQPTSRGLVTAKARIEAARSPALAIPTLKDWLARNPKDTEAALQLADLYLAADRADEVMPLLEPHANRPMNVALQRRCRTAMAFALYKSGQKARARDLFKSLQEADPADPAPVAAQMRLLREEGDWQQLEALARNWCRVHPRKPDVVIGIAGTLSESSDAQARALAERLLQEVLQTQPDSAQSLQVLGMLLQQTGRSEQAVQCYRKALAAQPDDVISMNNLAWILADEQGKLQEALQLADRGLRVAPDYADMLDTRGVIRHRLGQYAAAAEDFRRAISLYPEGSPALAGVYFHLGQVLSELDRKTEAVQHLERALSLAEKGLPLSPDDVAQARQLLTDMKGS